MSGQSHMLAFRLARSYLSLPFHAKKMACHNSFDVELLYITKTPNCRCLSTKTPEVTTKTPVVTTKTPLGNN